MTTPVETTLAVIPAGSSQQQNVGFVDRFGNGASLAAIHAPINTAGSRVDPATTEDVQGLGTILSGTLHVVSAIGTPLEASTVPTSLAGLNLLSSAAPSARIGLWFCQNQSNAVLTIALDDGAGNNLSVFLLSPTGSGQQGGSMGSADCGPHLGRIRVFGTAGSTHALRIQ